VKRAKRSLDEEIDETRGGIDNRAAGIRRVSSDRQLHVPRSSDGSEVSNETENACREDVSSVRHRAGRDTFGRRPLPLDVADLQ